MIPHGADHQQSQHQRERQEEPAGDDDLDVPPLVRRGGTFRPIEPVSREEKSEDNHDLPARPRTVTAKLIEPEEDEEEDLELPSFIRKKMK